MTDIALIVLDTLRYDAFEKHFDWLPGTRFEYAWSTSHWTVPAHASLFTGQYASEVGIYAGAQSFDCDNPLLAERLRDADYTTRAFSANPNISPTFDADRGFEQFEKSWRLEHHDEDIFNWDRFIAETRDCGPERYTLALKKVILGDNQTLPSLKHGVKLKLRDTRFGRNGGVADDGGSTALKMVRDTNFGDDEFLFLNLMEAHSPYNPPKEWKTVDVDINGLVASLGEPTDSPTDIVRAYDDSVQYLSHIYEQIFTELRTDFDLIVTVSDHGELLGEYGGWEHLYGIYPELSHIPLSIYEVNSSSDGIIRQNQPVSLLDVHETVLTAAGLSSKIDTRGRDLTGPLTTRNGDGQSSPIDKEGFLIEYHGLPERNLSALRHQGFDEKVIKPLTQTLEGIAYDTYYGFETFDGFKEWGSDSPYDHPEENLRNLVESLNRREQVANDEEIDESVMRQLKDLGYA